MRIVSRTVCVLLFLCTLAASYPLVADDDVPMKAMRDEMARSVNMQLSGLSKPYFVAYRIQDITDVSITADLGSIVGSQNSRTRLLQVQLRVGDYKLDNTNFLAFGTRQASGFGTGSQITVDDDYNELRREIWLATDSEYKKAVELFTAKQAALQNQSHGEDIADFTQERPNKSLAKQAAVAVNVPELESAARQVSAAFRLIPEPQRSQVVIDVHRVFTRYINSEGTEYTRPNDMVYIQIRATTEAEDGLPLEDTEQVFLKSAADVSAADLTARAQKMVERLQKLRTAKSFDRYNGPVLFEGKAGAEVFAQLFATALVASRDPVTDNPRAQAFIDQMTTRFGAGSLTDRVGGRVLPDSVTLIDNPTIETFNGQPLMGKYAIDEDGVTARANTIVESGVLKLVLSSRTPIQGVTHSTGSHRGFTAAPSNLIFTSTKGVSDQELRRMLLEKAKARGLEYGIVVRRAGGSADEFIQTAMSMMQGGGAAGNNMLEVYKLYADGHEELMHGQQLVGINAASFKDVVAVGDKPVVYNSIFIPGFSSLMVVGMTGDVSAITNMPVVSYVVPSLLFDDATLKKVSGPFSKPPLTTPPPLSAKGS